METTHDLSGANSTAMITKLIVGKLLTQVVSTAARLRVCDALRGKPRRAEELAPALGARTESLYRLLRALSIVGVTVENDSGYFSLTTAGECLCEDAPGSLRGLAILQGEGWHSAAVAAMEYSVSTGKSGFEHVYRETLWEFLNARADAAQVFDDSMTSASKVVAQAVIDAYPLQGYRCIVDVGGGHGFLIAAALNSAPGARGILLDRPAVAETARPGLEAAGLAQRCEAVGGDFMEAVPAGHDLYFIKHVIHNWSEDACARILSNVARAMAPGGKVLVIEHVVTPAGVPHFTKLLDMEMLVMTEGRERTEAEYRELFAKSGLELLRSIPTRASVSILEAARART